MDEDQHEDEDGDDGHQNDPGNGDPDGRFAELTGGLVFVVRCSSYGQHCSTIVIVIYDCTDLHYCLIKFNLKITHT